MLHVGMKCNGDDIHRAKIYLSIISAKHALITSSHLQGVYGKVGVEPSKECIFAHTEADVIGDDPLQQKVFEHILIEDNSQRCIFEHAYDCLLQGRRPS